MSTWNRYLLWVPPSQNIIRCNRQTSIQLNSLSLVPIEWTCFGSRSCLAFFHGTGDWADSLLDAASFIPLALLLACSPPVYLSIVWDSKWKAVVSWATKKSWTTVKLRWDGSSNAAIMLISVTGSLRLRACHMRCFVDITTAQSVGKSWRAASISALNSKTRFIVGYLEPLSTSVAVLKIFKNSTTFAIVFHSSSLHMLSNNRKRARHRSTSYWLINRLSIMDNKQFHLVGQPFFNV